jgi:hypothetical protein
MTLAFPLPSGFGIWYRIFNIVLQREEQAGIRVFSFVLVFLRARERERSKKARAPISAHNIEVAP